MLYTCLRWSASARAHVHTPFPDLANGWADCAQIWFVDRDPLDKCFTHVWGGVHLHVRTCTPPLPYLANGWADGVQILCVTRDPSDKCFKHVWGEVHLHVRTCTPLFQISQTAGRITFKFGLWLGTHWIELYKSQRRGASARAHVHTRFPYLANGWADCLQIWCVTSDPLDERLTTSQMWGPSARAHVLTSFTRWCLLARSFIADQGVILVYFVSKQTL